jgi:hypothetical protein
MSDQATANAAPSRRDMISLARERAEAGAAAIASGDYLAADILLKLALDYLHDGYPELKDL